MVLDGSNPPPFEASQFEPNVTDGTHAGARDQMKVEPTGCRSSISLVSYDVRVMITANDPALLGRLPEHFPPGWRPTDSAGVDELFSIFADVRTPGRRARPRNLLYRGPDLIATAPNIDQTLNQLESWLRLTVAVRARHRVFVHAGVVGWGGQALLLPGRSCSGKTTLVAALVRERLIFQTSMPCWTLPDASMHFRSRSRYVSTTAGAFRNARSTRSGEGRRSGRCPSAWSS